MPTLDVSALSAKKLKAAADIFDKFCNKPFLTFHHIQNDSDRKQLDDEFATKVLGLPKAICDVDGPLDLLRKKIEFGAVDYGANETTGGAAHTPAVAARLAALGDQYRGFCDR